MSQYLPYSGLKWLNIKEIYKFHVNSIECNSIEENSSDGYILDVDYEYSDELYKMLHDYPLVMICCQNTVAILQMKFLGVNLN